MTEPNKIKIYFSGDAPEIASKILQKYKLNETDEALEKKFLGNDPFNSILVLGAAIELAKKNISDEQAKSDLQKRLNVSKDIAEKLVNDIKKMIVSTATTKMPKITENMNKDIYKELVPAPKQKTEKSAVTGEIKKFVPAPKQTTKQTKGPDSYREPIE